TQTRLYSNSGSCCIQVQGIDFPGGDQDGLSLLLTAPRAAELRTMLVAWLIGDGYEKPDPKPTPEEVYYDGVREGITRYAWWKDGAQYVGTSGKTLAAALAEIRPPAEQGEEVPA
ncbi:MAG TPA: hypothetical protein VMW48_10650, partial [Vicinamibacterales bacterium]|nr:hypothetical protein [Vicinamibacterales bacterium]